MTELPASVPPRYDTSQSYRWNYDHAPEPPAGMKLPAVVPADPSRWDEVVERLANS